MEYNNMAGLPGVNNGLFIKKLVLLPTKNPYKDVYRRSYSLNADNRTMTSLENMFGMNSVANGGKLTELNVANQVPNIMTMSANVNGVAGITNGWDTQRFMYIMEVESILDSGTTISSYIQGYTEYHDLSFGGHLDPKMNFYMNSVTNVTRIQDLTTGQIITRPQTSYNIISDNMGNSTYQMKYDDGLDLQLIRPCDITDGLYNLSMYGQNNGTDVKFTDYTGTYTGNTSLSSRSNNNPLKHFTSTVNSFIESKSMSNVSHDENDILRNASNAVIEDNPLSTPFIAGLCNLTGRPDQTTFTLELLQKINPDISSRVTVTNRNNEYTVSSAPLLDTANTEDLYKANLETTLATTIAQSVSSVAVENLLFVIDFSVTNMTGQIVTIITNAESFIEGINITGYLNRVRANIENVLFPEISQNGLLMLDINVHSNVLGDTAIGISINNNPPVIYRFPTFADSLYNPVITDNNNKTMMTDNFGQILDATYVS